jgi:histidine triad (HIT) family protein
VVTAQACPFCRIVREEADAAILHRDESVVAFRDIRPVAPTHILVIPTRHIASVSELDSPGEGLVDRMIEVARDVAAREGLDTDGYRLVINTGPNAGQSVFHLHMHLLGGRRMQWPPG